MKKTIICAMILTSTMSGCKDNNPLLNSYNTPFNSPPFDKIEVKHYIPAFEVAIQQAREAVDAIVSNEDEPTFQNTIEALAQSDIELSEISGIFFSLNHAETNDQMEQIATEIQPILTAYSNDISLNKGLFERVKKVYDNRAQLTLDREQVMLLDNTYKGFARSGAALSPSDKEIYRAITTELSSLTLKFQQNLLAATNAYVLNIPAEDSAKVADLPKFVVEAMAAEAKERDMNGWCVTLQFPSFVPFITYSSQRDLKEQVWRAYNSRCFNSGENSNVEVVKRITELRLNIANLLGHKTYADYVLEERMAEGVDKVDDFLNDLLLATQEYAVKDFNILKEYAFSKDSSLKEFMPWDFQYFEEKYKSEKYSLNEEEIKPYLQLESVEKGVFLLAERLFKIRFVENGDVAKYHQDVKVYEVYGENDRYMGLLYMDFFPRAGKSGGAWMTTFRDMYVDGQGDEVRPLVSVCCNFTKPVADEPSLLTFDEFTTLLHEFGHALHGLFAEGKYSSMTGTNVYRDFVELPSQLLENWATESEFLDMWAVHYKTGEKMPQSLIDKIVAAKRFNAAYSNSRQLSFGMTDMAWHAITAPITEPIEVFEQNANAKSRLFPVVEGTCMATSFAHIFAGGYAAGYYSYKWAEVLEADAFSLFKEKGIFNTDVAEAYRSNILAKGGTLHPMELYVNFRGDKPDVTSLLDKMGIKRQQE